MSVILSAAKHEDPEGIPLKLLHRDPSAALGMTNRYGRRHHSTRTDLRARRSLPPSVRSRASPLVLNRRSYGWITERISGAVENRAPRWWWVAFAFTSGIAGFGLFCLGYQISTGVGTWGLNHPVGWAWDITNFVFWIGIGHAGTLISAILYLLRQKWRTSINRSAEAMTLFAVICAAIFPACTSGAFGWRGIWRRCRTITASGQISAARCSGTSLRSRPTSPFRCCSGTLD